jgi:ribonuclease Z
LTRLHALREIDKRDRASYFRSMTDVKSDATRVTLTGSGVPIPSPGRAGPGVLVRYRDVSLQFDAGRATVLRLEDCGSSPHLLSALFVTHVHSDHLVALADVAMTRWLQRQFYQYSPLPIVAPEGSAARFVRDMLDVYADDIATRTTHIPSEPPSVDLKSFTAPTQPEGVWRSEDGAVVVEAVAVHHEPVADAVGNRITTPTAVVVISGDTRVCDEIEAMSQDCDVLVHEAARTAALEDLIKGTELETILSYHADTVPLGTLAERAGVPHVVLTHLIPAPTTDDEEAAFSSDLRDGGYTGQITVGRDLTTVEVDNPRSGR